MFIAPISGPESYDAKLAEASQFDRDDIVSFEYVESKHRRHHVVFNRKGWSECIEFNSKTMTFTNYGIGKVVKANFKRISV